MKLEAALAVYLLALLQLASWTESSYTLRVRAHRYWNSPHKVSDGSCCDKPGRSNCDPSWCSYCQCDNRFKFCMRRRGNSRDGNENYCPLGSYSTGEIGDDAFSFGSSQIDSGVSNPMTFRGDVWRGGFQLLVSIYDEDINSDDHVDDLYVEERMNPRDSISERVYTGIESNANIRFSISLLCNSNFYGTDCATYCVAMDDDSGHYRCDRDTGEKLCRQGWSNPSNNCLTPVCAGNCHVIGGYCESPGECECLAGWSGSGCQQCERSAECSDVGGYCNVPGECICSEGYSGATCNVDLIPCQRVSPCSDEAVCTNDGMGGYTCHCPAGYTGTECDQEINECDPNPCYNGSTCIDELNGFSCECPDGFEGGLCHIDIDECVTEPCLNGSTCVDTANGFVCLCVDGYEGELCDRDHDDCMPYPCENGGTCRDILGGYECECAPGWNGDRCHVDIDDCVSVPCQNGGTCFDLVDRYTCVCERGWEGQDCHQEINECDPNPCQNEAECTDLFASYNCSCVAGYFGAHCEHEYDECLPGPCLNGGSCRDLVNGYSCYCSDGFTGSNCETDLYPCRTSPCQNGGTCMEHGNGYSCVCAVDYTDYDCVSEIDVQVEGLASEDEEVGTLNYIVWGVPLAILLILILIVSMAILTVYCRRKKRIPILPPPSEPMENGMETGKKAGKACPGSLVSNPVYGAPETAPDPNVYESIDDYAVPRDISLINIPLPDSTEYDDTLFNIDASNSITPNPYATPQQL